MTRKRLLLAASLLGGSAMLASGPAAADVEDGVDAWSRGDYDAAIREWKGPAAQGDADAQFNLAQAYKLGRGVQQDLARAEKLYGEAAARGHLQAADNYGLLLFQRGEKTKAMPFVHAASDRGDPRAQYILGLAYFNGDGVAKDWTRAYALVSLAQQASLPQAAGALSQMDQFIPLEQRQQSVVLASQLASSAEATRRRQVAAADLGVTSAGSQLPPSPRGQLKPFKPATPPATGGSAPPGSPATAGADYTVGRVPQVASIMDEAEPKPAPRPVPIARPAPVPAPARVARPAPARTVAPVPVPAPAGGGAWRVQLGAFGVPGNAEGLWNRVRNRPELAGHAKLLVPAGRVTKLQAGGFADRAAAQAACNRLEAAGIECLAVKD